MTVDKQLDKGLFVHHAAAGNVDQISLRPQGFQHRTADELFGLVAARRGDDQHINGFGQFHRGWDVAIRRVRYRPPIVISNRALESDEPGSDRQADPAQTEDANPASTDLIGQREPFGGAVAFDGPAAGPHVTIHGGQPAHCREHQADRAGSYDIAWLEYELVGLLDGVGHDAQPPGECEISCDTAYLAA